MERRIKFPDLSNWIQNVELSGKIYIIQCVWNSREKCWIMSLSSANGDKLVDSIKLVLGYPLLYGKKYNTKLPPGQFIVVCPNGTCRENPNRYSFNEDMELLYVV